MSLQVQITTEARLELLESFARCYDPEGGING